MCRSHVEEVHPPLSYGIYTSRPGQRMYLVAHITGVLVVPVGVYHFLISTSRLCCAPGLFVLLTYVSFKALTGIRSDQVPRCPLTSHPEHRILSDKLYFSKKGQKTYNTRDSLVVTDPTTNLALTGLSMGERTGSRILQWVWSYVEVYSSIGGDILRLPGTTPSQSIIMA